jgi:hypothetical protein
MHSQQHLALCTPSAALTAPASRQIFIGGHVSLSLRQKFGQAFRLQAQGSRYRHTFLKDGKRA